MHQLSRTGAPLLALRFFRALGRSVDVRTLAFEGGALEVDFARLGRLRVLATYPHLLPNRMRMRQRALVAKAFGLGRLPIEGWLARRWSPDVVYANSVWSLPLLKRLGRNGQPVLLHVHESSVALKIFENAHPGLIASLPSSYVAVSFAVARELQVRYGVPAALVRVIPPFVDLPTDRPLWRNREGGPLVIGGIGYPGWTKGCELWLLAARELVDQLGDEAVRFKWVGIPDNEEGIRFRAMVEKLDLGRSVDAIGQTSEPLDHLRTFDVLAVTSWEESASLVVLEAMAVGVPVACYRDSGGPGEELLGTGVVVDEFSPSAMAGALAELIADPIRRRDLASGAHDRVRRTYSSQQVVPSLMEEIGRLATVGRDT
jgi:glycosyltransferase involved in cell wall biosynthesis